MKGRRDYADNFYINFARKCNLNIMSAAGVGNNGVILETDFDKNWMWHV